MNNKLLSIARKQVIVFGILIVGVTTFGLVGCATTDTVKSLDESVQGLESSVSELNLTTKSLRQPAVATAMPACGPPGQSKKIDLDIVFVDAGVCQFPLDVESGDNGCVNKTLPNVACICRNNAANEKITWQAVGSDGKKINLVYRIYFGPFDYLESNPSGKIMDKTVNSATPVGPYKYSIVSGVCTKDPHIIIE